MHNDRSPGFLETTGREGRIEIWHGDVVYGLNLVQSLGGFGYC